VSRPLAGRTVVVTRPARQSGGIAAALGELGARVVEFPSIRIVPVPQPAAGAEVHVDDFDWVIYTSVNAVAFAGRRIGVPARAQVAAIGPATAQALAQTGIRVAAQPEGSADSEGLLALPVFATPAGLRILIARGAGGRDVLRSELERRGAVIEVIDLYRRVPETPTPAAIVELAMALRSGRVMVAVSSGDVLRALMQITPAALDAGLRTATLVVPGPRVAAVARELGWQGALVESAGAEDAAMVRAIVEQSRQTGPA
jgi:uroporphyrinogen-III synthase